MRCAFIKRGALEQFWRKHPDAQVGLESGYEIVRQAHWKTPAEMQRVYPHVDVVGRRVVFNIAGNRYRLILRMNYRTQCVFILYVLSHAEYDKGAWKQ